MVQNSQKEFCVLVNPKSVYQLSIVETDTQGRYLIAKLLIEKTAFFLINIYTPNDYREQEQFIKMLSENIAAKTDVLKVIIAGDWNTTLKQTDKYGGIPWKETAYRNSIIDLTEELDICSLCPNPDSIEHSFLHCTESVNFYMKTLSWFNNYHSTRIHLPHEHIVLNTFEDVFPPKLSSPVKRSLCLLILFRTKYLYTCKKLS